MGPGRRGGHPPPGRPDEQALADEERLVHVLDGLVRLPDGDGQVGQPHRPAPEALAQRSEHGPVDLVEATLVHPEGGQARLGRVVVDGAVAPHLGEVAHPPQEPVGDARGAAGPPGDLAAPVGVDRHLEDGGCPLDDGLEVGGVVVVEPGHEPEAVAQRAGDQTGAGGGADQGEVGDVESDRPGGRALAQHDVELEVLHRRVEHLFDGPGQPVDLVDEEHVALAELAEDGGEVAAPLEGRARGDVQPDVHLDGDDVGEARLAEAGGSGEEQVVGGLRPAPSRLEDDREVLLELRLADEVVEPAGPEPQLGGRLRLVGRSRLEQLVAHGDGLSARPRRAGAAPP